MSRSADDTRAGTPAGRLPNGDLLVTTPQAPQYMRAAFEILWRTRQRRRGLPLVAPPRPTADTPWPDEPARKAAQTAGGRAPLPVGARPPQVERQEDGGTNTAPTQDSVPDPD